MTRVKVFQLGQIFSSWAKYPIYPRYPRDTSVVVIMEAYLSFFVLTACVLVCVCIRVLVFNVALGNARNSPV